MDLLGPQSRSRTADCIMNWEDADGVITLNFSQMPLGKLVRLQEPHRNPRPDFGWADTSNLAKDTADAIFAYHGRDVFISVEPGDGFTIKAKLGREMSPNPVATLLERYLTRVGLTVA